MKATLSTRRMRAGTIADGSEGTAPLLTVSATTVSATSGGPTRPIRGDARSITLVSAAFAVL